MDLGYQYFVNKRKKQWSSRIFSQSFCKIQLLETWQDPCSAMLSKGNSGPTCRLACDTQVSGFYLTNDKGEGRTGQWIAFMITKNHKIQLHFNSFWKIY